MRSKSHKSFTLSGCIGFPNSPQLCSMVNKHRITQNMIALEHLKKPNRHGSSKRPQTKPQKCESKTRHWSIWEIQDMQDTHARNSKHPIYTKACAKCNSPRYSTTSFNTKYSCYQDYVEDPLRVFKHPLPTLKFLHGCIPMNLEFSYHSWCWGQFSPWLPTYFMTNHLCVDINSTTKIWKENYFCFNKIREDPTVARLKFSSWGNQWYIVFLNLDDMMDEDQQWK